MARIPIALAQHVQRECDATHVVIWALDRAGTQQVATFGETEVAAGQAAESGNRLKDALGWPPKTHSTPLKRECQHCAFHAQDRPPWGSYERGIPGRCVADPTPVRRDGHEHACRQWEPKG
jgi:hypothetical protein